MEEKLNLIIKSLSDQINEALPPERVKEDFWQFVINNFSELMITAEANNNEWKDIELSLNDELTVFSTVVVMSHRDMTYVPLEITLGIGECKFDSGTYFVSKCRAKLYYNHLLELVSMDFFYSKMHDLTLD